MVERERRNLSGRKWFPAGKKDHGPKEKTGVKRVLEKVKHQFYISIQKWKECRREEKERASREGPGPVRVEASRRIPASVQPPEDAVGRHGLNAGTHLLRRFCTDKGNTSGAAGIGALVPGAVFMGLLLFQKPFPVLEADFLQGRPALVAVQFLEPEGVVFLRIA